MCRRSVATHAILVRCQIADATLGGSDATLGVVPAACWDVHSSDRQWLDRRRLAGNDIEAGTVIAMDSAWSRESGRWQHVLLGFTACASGRRI